FLIGQDGHAVEALLPMPDRAIADPFEVGGREAVILAFDFLQAGDGRAGFLQPFQQARQAGADTVDIETGDLHARSCPAALGAAASSGWNECSDCKAGPASAASGGIG